MMPLWFDGSTPLVLADADARDIVKIIAFVFAGLWFVLKLATDRMRQAGPPPGQRPPVPPIRPAANRDQRAPLAGGGDPRDEVADFLRRAQMRQGSAPVRPPAPPKPPGKKSAKKQERRPELAQRGERKSDRTRLSSSAPSPEPSAAGQRSPVDRDARGGLRTTQLTDEANQAFGSYAGAAVSDAMALSKPDMTAATGTASSDVLGLFGDADKLQQAFILAEILQPPRDRFE